MKRLDRQESHLVLLNCPHPPAAIRFRSLESWPVSREIFLRMGPTSVLRNQARPHRDPCRLREPYWTTRESPRCAHQAQPCSLQRDLLAQERETSSSLLAARGDGARPCPPKAPPSP